MKIFMRNVSMVVILAAVCVAVAGLCLCLCGCSNQTVASKNQANNRTYMANVNTIMAEFSETLEGFSAASLDGDVVTMGKIVDNATVALDKISGLTAPEALKSVHTLYVDGSAAMKTALKNYLALYKQLRDGSVTVEQFNAQISGVQSAYDDAYAKLKEADQRLAEMK